MRDFRRALIRGMHEQCNKSCPRWLIGKIFRSRIRGPAGYPMTSQAITENVQNNDCVALKGPLGPHPHWSYGSSDFNDKSNRPLLRSRKLAQSESITRGGDFAGSANRRQLLRRLETQQEECVGGGGSWGVCGGGGGKLGAPQIEWRGSAKDFRESTPTTIVTLEPTPSPALRPRANHLADSNNSMALHATNSAPLPQPDSPILPHQAPWPGQIRTTNTIPSGAAVFINELGEESDSDSSYDTNAHLRIDKALHLACPKLSFH